jgi:hypothetical protein
MKKTADSRRQTAAEELLAALEIRVRHECRMCNPDNPERCDSQHCPLQRDKQLIARVKKESAAVCGLPSAVSSTHMESCPFVGMHETCPAHPSRLAPAGQWSEEMPTKDGWYAVSIPMRGVDGYRHEFPAKIYSQGRTWHLQSSLSDKSLHEFCEMHRNALWLPISIPPLSGGEGRES